MYAIPYHKQFEAEVKEVSDLLIQASELAEDEGLKNYYLNVFLSDMMPLDRTIPDYRPAK